MNEYEIPEAWVTLPSEAEVRAALGGTPHPYEVYTGGVVPRMSRLIMAHDVIGKAYVGLSKAIMFSPGALTRAEREMLAAVTASAQDCYY